MPLSHGRLISGLENAEAIIADVKASRCFGKSARQLRLFEYLLKASLKGQASEVSQYSLALDVLERPESFDPTTDSIVRVELHRLRASLEVYNSSTNAHYHVSVPPASFEVVVQDGKKNWLGALFKGKVSAPTYAILMACGAIAVGGFVLSSPQSISIQHQCSSALPNISMSYVGDPSETQNYVESVLRSAISQQTSFHLLQPGQSCGVAEAPIFDVQYTIVEKNDLFNVALKVLDAETSSIIESHHIKGALSETDENSELYYKLVSTANDIAMPSDTLARYANNRQWSVKSRQRGFGCLIAMYDSYAGEIDSEFDTVHDCLEASVKSGAAPLDSYGALASSYFDMARNDRAPDVSDPFQLGAEIIKARSNDWFESSELAIAKIYYETDRAEINNEQLELALITAKSKFNTNPQVLLMVAASYGYDLGKWDEAMAISDYVKRIYSTREQSIYGVDAAYLLMRDAQGQDMQPCYNYYTEDSIFVNIIVNACAVRDKNEYWLEKTQKNLERFELLNVSDRVDYIETRVNSKNLVQRLRTILKTPKSD